MILQIFGLLIITYFFELWIQTGQQNMLKNIFTVRVKPWLFTKDPLKYALLCTDCMHVCMYACIYTWSFTYQMFIDHLLYANFLLDAKWYLNTIHLSWFSASREGDRH